MALRRWSPAYSVVLPTIDWGNFARGVNYRDSLADLEAGDLMDAQNVTIDNMGGLEKRLGYANLYPGALGTGLVNNLFYWKTNNRLIAQEGQNIHLDGTGVVKTFTTSARVAFAEFLTDLYVIHPVDGLFKITSAGVVSGPIANAPPGNALCTWQNRLWSNDSANSGRVVYSGIGTPGTWTPEFVGIFDKDSAPITALRAIQGAIIAFKAESTYNIYDSNTAAYRTIDPHRGCGSNIGHEFLDGRIYAISKWGIYSTDGISPMVFHSARITPYFPNIVNFNREDLMCAGVRQDKLYFSIPQGTNTANSLELEFHPRLGWIMPHTRAASCYATIGDGTLKFGSPSIAGRIYSGDTGGDDAGVPITSFAQVRFIEPLKGVHFRVRRVSVTGFGVFTVSVYGDYSNSSAGSFLAELFGTSAVYGDPGSTYDGSTYYTDVGFFENIYDEPDLGVYSAISLRIDETSSLTSTKRTPPAAGSGQVTLTGGAWSLADINLKAVTLGDT